MRTRQLGALDYYAELGVQPDATPAEIAATYRSLVKSLHPDARPTDPTAAERFTRVTEAYRVLGDVGRRRDYDERRARGIAPIATRVAATGAPAQAEAPPSRRSGRWAIVGGIACLVAGMVVAGLIITLQRHDAELRSRGRSATATVVLVGSDRRLQFRTGSGQLVNAPEPLRTGTGDAPVGAHVSIRYDPQHPTQVITTDDKLARDVTLWIIAVKLILVGTFFVGFGIRRLRRARSPAAR